MLWGVLYQQYGRLEARHPDLDFLSMSLRKALNLAFELLVEMYQFDEKGWKEHVEPVFSGSEQGDSDALDVSALGGRGL